MSQKILLYLQRTEEFCPNCSSVIWSRAQKLNDHTMYTGSLQHFHFYVMNGLNFVLYSGVVGAVSLEVKQ
jgi:hypothetical protein